MNLLSTSLEFGFDFEIGGSASDFHPTQTENYGANNLPYLRSPSNTLQVIITLSLMRGGGLEGIRRMNSLKIWTIVIDCTNWSSSPFGNPDHKILYINPKGGV
jgi:hypothetical protein